MVIHISKERYEGIRAQGYPLGTFPAVRDPSEYRMGDTEFHLLDGDRAICQTCGIECESVAVISPVDLEVVKEELRQM